MFCRVFCILNVYTVEGMFMYTWQQLVLLSASNLQRGSPHLFSGGGGGGRGSVKHGSGRSPFVRRLQTPLSIASQKRSKSVSPLGRLSPFSQTIHSNTWSTVYSEESAMSLEPLLPQICMHLIFETEER